MKNWNKGKDTQPSHTDIKHGREPFRAGDPESLKKDTKDRNAPYKSTEDVTNTIMQCNQADWSVASCNHNENHHMIHLTQATVNGFCRINGMINRACCIEKDHSEDKNCQCRDMKRSIFTGSSPEQKRYCTCLLYTSDAADE